MFQYTHALVRRIPKSFEQALSSSPAALVDVAKAILQHETYIQALQKILGIENVIIIQEDNKYPDCCFIEDTCVVAEDIVMLTRLGHTTRRGETDGVAVVIKGLMKKPKFRLSYFYDKIFGKNTEIFQSAHIMEEPALLDGGDVLVMKSEIFVGISTRTNNAALEQMAKAFPSYKIIAITVEANLHLKSSVSALDENTLIIWEKAEGTASAINSKAQKTYELVKVPDAPACNVVRVRDYLLVQAGCPHSLQILQSEAQKRNLKVIEIDTSELGKADGLLTCCSVLF